MNLKPDVGEPIPKDTLVELSSAYNKKCKFCNKKKSSEQLYGILYQFNDVIAHHFCILLSSKSIQNGEDHQGIWGFLECDIKKEICRGSKITCCYCDKKGATISCQQPKCEKTFHLPCGMQHNSMHQFFGEFKSFCEQHRSDQVFDKKTCENLASVQCTICLQPIPQANIQKTSLKAPCCNDAWFHRHCIQNVALNSGFCFRCPICNDDDEFKSTMLIYGIYIPSRHASWDWPGAYSSLTERPNICSAEKCLCPRRNRRRFNQEDGRWRFIVCNTCGLNGTHAWCSGIGNEDDYEWNCETCTSVVGGPKGPKRKR